MEDYYLQWRSAYFFPAPSFSIWNGIIDLPPRKCNRFFISENFSGLDLSPESVDNPTGFRLMEVRYHFAK